MSHNTGRAIHLRGFVSLLTALSFLVMTVSGIILFVVPQGRIASWVDWHMFGLTKVQWGDIHITTSLLFALAGLWHTWLNWRALVSYFKDRATRTLVLKKELLAAALLTVFFTVGAVYKTPPLDYILDFNDAIKEYWVKTPADEPPIAHAELLPFATFVKKTDLDLDTALKTLEKHGIKLAGPDQKLGDIASANHTSPAAIYSLLSASEEKGALPDKKEPGQPQKKESSSTVKTVTTPQQKVWTPDLIQSEFEGKGVGRKTLAEICAEFKLDQAVVSKKLAARKIIMGPDDTLKQTGTKHNELPLEIMKIILAGEVIK